MTTSVRTRGQVPDTHADCGCGCGGKGRCCGLECLTRPNFYCGQLLTDADLSATVQWVRDRLGLVRYRDGWGVVCGLEVTCRAPEGGNGCCSNGGNRSRVWVNPGYAVDCCGNDLVVCEPLCVDLSDVCRPADDPCADPCLDAPPADPRDPTGARRDATGTSDGAATDETLDIGNWHIPKHEVLAVDLSLRYGEQPQAGQRAMFRSGCSGESACEYARMLERPQVVKTIADLTAEREIDEAEEFKKRVQQSMTKAVARIRALLTGQKSDIVGRLADYPVYGACFIPDYIRAQSEDVDSWKVQVGSWLLVDFLQHELFCGCGVCRTDQGVPIARLLLWRKNGRADCCRVLSIAMRPPYRRPLKTDCRPVPAGKVDLAQTIGQPIREGNATLLRESLVVEQPTVAAGVHEVTSELLADPGARVRPITMRDWMGVETIVGVQRVP